MVRINFSQRCIYVLTLILRAKLTIFFYSIAFFGFFFGFDSIFFKIVMVLLTMRAIRG